MQNINPRYTEGKGTILIKTLEDYARVKDELHDTIMEEYNVDDDR